MPQINKNINYSLDFKIYTEFLVKQKLSIKNQIKKFKYNMYGLRDVKKNFLPLDYYVSIKILFID